jgi:hypothetical protein
MRLSTRVLIPIFFAASIGSALAADAKSELRRPTKRGMPPSILEMQRPLQLLMLAMPSCCRLLTPLPRDRQRSRSSSMVFLRAVSRVML